MMIQHNDYVYVKLTKAGRDVIQKSGYSTRGVGKGWSRFLLWELMETFGQHLSVVSKPFYEGDAIYCEKPDELK